jgi:hypothetical protein
MKKKYFTPEMEEMEVEMPSLLDATSETGSDITCTSYTPSCTDNWG